MIKAFVDANLLFSAALDLQGRVAFQFRQADPQKVAFLTSQGAIGEARRNLEIKAPAAARHLDEVVKGMKVVSDPARAVPPAGLPPEDVHIWQAAQSAGADYLLTGDKKLLRATSGLKGLPKTMTLSDFIARP